MFRKSYLANSKLPTKTSADNIKLRQNSKTLTFVITFHVKLAPEKSKSHQLDPTPDPSTSTRIRHPTPESERAEMGGPGARGETGSGSSLFCAFI